MLERANRKLQPSTILKRQVALAASDRSPREMKKVLGIYEIIGFGISTTIGSGVFVSVGIINTYYAGGATFITFIIAALGCALSALCYAEFGSRYPVAGQAYTYLYASVGELSGFVCGCLCFITYTIATAAVSRGFASYFGTLYFSITNKSLPDWLIATPRSFGFVSFSALACLLCIACTALALAGVQEGAKVSTVFAFLNLCLILSFTVYGGIYYSDFSNLEISSHLTTQAGVGGILKGVGLAYFCVLGWDLVLTLSEEVKHPQRDLPRGLVVTLIIVTVVYASLSLVVCSMAPPTVLDPSASVAHAFLSHKDRFGALLVSIAATSSCVSSVVSGVVGPPRIIYRMSLDGLLPESLSRLSGRRVPLRATLIAGSLSSILGAFLEFEPLAAVTSCTALAVYGFVAAAILIARRPRIGTTCLIFFFFSCLSFGFSGYTVITGIVNLFALAWVSWKWRQSRQPETPMRVGLLTLPIEEPFLCPWVPWLPLASVWVNSQMMVALGVESVAGAVSVIFIAVLLYFTYGQSHSALN